MGNNKFNTAGNKKMKLVYVDLKFSKTWVKQNIISQGVRDEVRTLFIYSIRDEVIGGISS